MIDPKFNELPAPPEEGKKKSSRAKPRRSLGINETIAADANKSRGAASLDTANMSTGFDRHDPSSLEPLPYPFSGEEIALRAFELWKERGCPVGSPEIDWREAEQDLLARSRGSKASVAGV